MSPSASVAAPRQRTPTPPLLTLRGISKSFGAVVANDDVDLELHAGEIHALLGENGAGKSTLIKIIAGNLRPDRGQILWKGQEISLANPRAARDLGIAVVSQHFCLFEALSVAENISLGLARAHKGWQQAIARLAAGYGLEIDLARRLGSLSAGERQRVEIVRCLSNAPQLLLLDEPSSVLTPQEATHLFAALRTLAAEGCCVLYISHKLPEIKELCAQATVLRDGRVVARRQVADTAVAQLAEDMIGGTPPLLRRRAAHTLASYRPRLQAVDLTLAPKPGEAFGLHGINFTLHEGEILGIAGVAGNGQQGLYEILSGERRSPASALILKGRPIGQCHPEQRRRLGLGSLPEERNGHSAVGGMGLYENTYITGRQRRRLARNGFLLSHAARAFAHEIITHYGVKTRGVEAPAQSLSGGNLQRFVCGREILAQPKTFVVAQPTWGVDAGAAAAIHQEILNLAARGVAILVISQDLDELFALCDRLAVLSRGRLSPPIPVAEADAQSLGLLMGGSQTAWQVEGGDAV